ncbi:MAG: thiamine pyrophosphate-dependent enzyme [Gemmatimonadota bacterium]
MTTEPGSRSEDGGIGREDRELSREEEIGLGRLEGFATAPLPCTEECLLRAGNTNCGGCGMSVGLIMLGRALADVGDTCTLAIPACCGAVTAGAFPTTSYGVPTVCTTFASAAAVASGLASIRDLNQEPGQVICWAGDGGTYDIGIATLSAAAERDENIIYICYDNEIYGNTGGQRSSATPLGARTSTTPKGKSEDKKDILAIMAAHRIPYAATLSIAHPEDFSRKLKTAFSISGTRFLLMHSPCPTGWKSEPAESVELVRVAVASGLFPLYEVWGGHAYRINVEPDWTDPAMYFQRQRRFRDDELDLETTRRVCRERFARLKVLAEEFPYEEAVAAG